MKQSRDMPGTTTLGPPAGASDAQLHGAWLRTVRVAWLVLALACVGVVIVGIPLRYAQLRRVPTPWPGASPWLAASEVVLYSTFVATCLALAALLLWRTPTSRLPLYAAFAFVLFGTGLNGSINALERTASAWGTAARLLGNLGPASAAIVLFIFPDGRFVPRWTRWSAALWLGFSLAGAILPGSPLDPTTSALGPPLQVVLLLSSALAQVYRYRYVSNTIERQQTKWIVAGVAAMVAVTGTITVYWYGPFPLPASPFADLAAIWLYYVAVFLIPLSFTVAVLRHRLWDIDRLINRALVYGALTGLLAAVYFGGVALVGRGIGLVTGRQSSQLAVVASTLAIAALFQPVRRRIQGAIDHRFYRRKYDTARVVAAFGMRLRDETDLDRLSVDLVAVVNETVQPAHVSLWLRAPASGSGMNAGVGDGRGNAGNST